MPLTLQLKMKRQMVFFSVQRRPSFSRIKLLTYPMAFAQPHTTLPLTQKADSKSTDFLLSGQLKTSCHVKLRNVMKEYKCSYSAASGVVNSRRWVRGPEELCVASIRRSNNVNRMNRYVATYKFDDPQWAPLLLPDVVLRHSGKTVRKREGKMQEADGAVANSSLPHGSAQPIPLQSSSLTFSHGGNNNNDNRGNNDADNKDYCISIDYNKLATLECIARHVNFSLRHIVQKGHGVYLLHHTQHSLLRPKGIVEQSYVTCSFGVRGERLRTDIVHVGPLDAIDIIDVENGHNGHVRCVFNFQKPNVPRGVVAVSQVEGYGTWFQRKPMLWQRSRRIGALQSQLGAFAYEHAVPHDVGKQHDHDVFLLAPHMRFFGNGAGGAEAVGIIASSQVARQQRLYLGEFEAPAITALDAVHQLAHASALRSRLVTPPRGLATEDESGDGDGVVFADVDRAETLLPVSWATRTPPPYVPLEADLPFKLQMSKPAVFSDVWQAEAMAAYPTGGTVGSPFVCGAPIVLFEYNLHQGVDHYVFDDAPSARPMKWWSQKSNMPYSGYMYFVRSGLIDRLSPSEEIENPLETAKRRKPLHTIVPPTKTVQRRVKRYKEILKGKGNKTKNAEQKTNVSATATATNDNNTTNVRGDHNNSDKGAV